MKKAVDEKRAAPSFDPREVLRFARLTQVPRLLRRAIGLAAVERSDFLPACDPAERARLRAIADAVRGPDRRPAVFVHGVLPRSGTNFVADALALHPDLLQNPGRLWEFPLLCTAEAAEALQREFLFMFPPNAEAMGRRDMFACMASGWMKVLQDGAGDRRMLFKSPHVRAIGLFPAIFPGDVLILVLRDGRDVIRSSEGTFAGGGAWRKRFRTLAHEWREGCEAIMSFAPGGENACPEATVVRYEDLVREPEGTMRRLLAHAGLDPARYDFDALKRLPVRGSSTKAAEAGWTPVERTDDFDPLGRWKDWPDKKKARFEAIAGDAARRAGYGRDEA